MTAMKLMGSGALLALAVLAGGCQAIKDKRGYLAEDVLLQSVQPGLDNMKSVEATLGRPTFASQYGQQSWYYVSSTTSRRPFSSPKIKEHSVFTVNFDSAGKVISTETSGMERLARLSPDGKKTPTLGRERSFFEDLFGNIGAVGAGAAPGGS
ncbi:MAG: outer membrane protein assembly factor BamE [Novosphingobium sp.]|uniref:outer membrane protein assembly factor BamE n=1 Tax=Tsuneonella sp. CC-YZS046 TaxID=3042152 RepID=UPI002D799B5B|nr:outer membrane protein assembly factor BamE [Tsuneonella sp. CC-YZS046]WRO65350.1 outer membrane protein assembly factor BamE [Tsuneonella sp. CC-YZS046]